MDPLPPAAQPNQPITPLTPAAQPSGLISPNKLYQPQNAQNLVRPVTVSKTESPNAWKTIVLDIITILCAAAFGYSFARYLAGGLSFWFVFGALLLWGSASVIEGFIQRSLSRRFLIIFIESVTLVAFFYTYALQALAITAVVVLFCLMWGYIAIRREVNNTIEIRFFAASGKIMGKVVTAAVIFMVIMYASLANDRGNFFVSQNGFNVFFTWASGFVNNFYPTVPLNGSVGDFAQAVARMQLQGNQQFQSLAPAEQNVILAQSADQIIGALSSGSSTQAVASTTPAVASESASSAIYNYLSDTMQKLQAHFSNTFIGVWGLLLFLILRSIGIIVVWIAQFVSLIFYELLLALGFMKISEQVATKENIEY